MSKPTINLDDKVDLKEDTLGTLIVVLLKARNLNDKHKFRKQDVFAQASLNGASTLLDPLRSINDACDRATFRRPEKDSCRH